MHLQYSRCIHSSFKASPSSKTAGVAREERFNVKMKYIMCRWHGSLMTHLLLGLLWLAVSPVQAFVAPSSAAAAAAASTLPRGIATPQTRNPARTVFPIRIQTQYYHQRQPYPPASTTKLQALSSPATLAVHRLVETFHQQQPLFLWTSSSYFLTRIVFLRALGVVYFVAFLVAYHQNQALIGDHGITPARWELEEARDRARLKRERRAAWLEDMVGNDTSSSQKRTSTAEHRPWTSAKALVTKIRWLIRRNKLYQRTREVLWDRADRMGRPLTTVLWFARDFAHINPWLDGIALTGMFFSALVAILGAANVPILLLLWICQRSLMAVGQQWYGYGWEVQLAELGFHALFLVPLFSLNPISLTPVPGIVLWTIRWYLFRIMIGAGLIKFRSNDKKWRNLTTMYYFYETQPVPSVFTRTMHFMPKAWHRFEVLVNHFVECVAPFLLIVPFLPRTLIRFAGLIQMQFQATLICTGNLSFLNWLTMVPAILCLDDAFLRGLFSPSRVVEASIAAATSMPSVSRRIVSTVFGGLVMWLSVPVIRNLLSKKQQMNASFDPLRLINTYGAFGVVNEEREEWVIKSAAEITSNDDYDSREYEFKVKPGNVNRRPRWITPYHYRLDWQMWIAASCRTLERSPWLYRFLFKLLQKDKTTQQLLEKDPFEGEAKQPKHIRVDCYRYRFHQGKDDSDRGGKKAPYWDREFVRRVYPRQGTATVESLRGEIQSIQPNRPI